MYVIQTTYFGIHVHNHIDVFILYGMDWKLKRNNFYRVSEINSMFYDVKLKTKDYIYKWKREIDTSFY